MKEFLKTLSRRLYQRIAMTYGNDMRSCRLVAVIDCILNQNTRDAGAAAFPAMNWEVIRLCNEYNVSILQMPCPEIGFLGFHRKRQSGESIREALDTDEGRRFCLRISVDVADRIDIYLSQGYKVLAVLGGNPKSPGCAVHSDHGGLLATSGIFMRELQDELQRRGIATPIKGIRDYDPVMLAQDLEWLKGVFMFSKSMK